MAEAAMDVPCVDGPYRGHRFRWDPSWGRPYHVWIPRITSPGITRNATEAEEIEWKHLQDALEARRRLLGVYGMPVGLQEWDALSGALARLEELRPVVCIAERELTVEMITYRLRMRSGGRPVFVLERGGRDA